MRTHWQEPSGAPGPSAPSREFGERRRERRSPARVAALLSWSSDGEGEAIAATVEDISPSGLGVRLDDTPSDRGAAVWVLRHDAAPERAEVRHVTPDLDQRRVGLLRIAVERRAEERRPSGEEGSLRRSGEVEPETAVVRNLSPHGAQLAAERPFAPGESVRLLDAAGERDAAVRYCEPWQGRYLVGVRFSGAA